MAWPPSLSSGTFLAQGAQAATLVWGTDGVLTSYAAVVLSVKFAQTNEIIYIEDGNGVYLNRLYLRQGETCDITIICNSDEVEFEAGDPITVLMPNGGGQNGGGAEVAFTVVTDDFEGARKQEGRRTISAVFHTMIDGGGTVLAG